MSNVMHIEIVSDALKETPPDIKGFFVDGEMYPLENYRGDGASRVFYFEKIGSRTFRELLRANSRVALSNTGKQFTRLKIKFGGNYVECPACGKRLKSGLVFWQHYDAHHAIRPRWLNRSDWEKMIGGDYIPPPD